MTCDNPRYPYKALYRFTVLEKAYMTVDPQKAAQYKALKQSILDKYGAQSYYESNLLPLIDALDKK